MFGKKISLTDMETFGFYDIVFSTEGNLDICEANIDCKVGRKLVPVKFVARVRKGLGYLFQRHKLFTDIINQHNYFLEQDTESKKEILSEEKND